MSNTKNRFDGIARLYGEQGAKKLLDSHVLVVGLGGVGTWAAEALVRSGVGSITIVDMDEVCISNTNRQIHAMEGQFGQMKVDAMAKRLKLINPECNITSIVDFFTKETKDQILNKEFHYVIDCIDSMRNKCLLIEESVKRNLPIITTGGAGGRMNPAKIQIADLNKSFRDQLLSRMRYNLKKYHGFHRIKKQPYNVMCVFSPETQTLPEQDCQILGDSLNCNTGFGATTHITGIFGFMAAAHVINTLVGVELDDKNEG